MQQFKERLGGLLSAQDSALLAHASIVLVATLGARILASLREVILLSRFGATATTDAIAASTTVPDYIQFVALSGLVAPVLMPHLARSRSGSNGEQWLNTIGQAIVWAAVVSCAVAAISECVAQPLIQALNPGLEPHTEQLATGLLRWSLVFLPLTTLSAVLTAVLQSTGNFRIPAITTLAMNGTLIAVLVAGADYVGAGIIVVALAAGSTIQALLLVGAIISRWAPAMRAPQFRFSIAANVVDSGWRVSVISFVLYGRIAVERLLASEAAPGTLAVVSLASRVMLVAAVLASIPIGTAMFPQAVSAFESGSSRLLLETVNRSFLLTLVIGAVALSSLLLFSGPLIEAVFGGALARESIGLLQRLILVFAPGVLGFALAELNTRVLLAIRSYGTALNCAVLGGVTTIVLQWWLQHDFGPQGIAAGASIGSFGYASITTILLVRRGLLRFSLVRRAAGL